ncbi:MAG: cyclic AMP receptor protein [Bdellovibrio sp.]|nr:MAG: cyclic AMP receptor protein [Bdellovibrio sp.]
MREPEMVDRRVFIVASAIEERRKDITDWINRHIGGAVVFTATDGSDALFKIRNTPPAVLITDFDLPRISGRDVVQTLLRDQSFPDISIIIISELLDEEHFVDEVVTQRVQFFFRHTDELEFSRCLAHALNRIENKSKAEYRLHFLSNGEVLFREGDHAESVFILRRGLMEAVKGSADGGVVLGKVSTGEFVGEMAHINKDNRSATVVALEDCELIEIPMGTLDFVLFSKPAWASALIKTLSKRLKNVNHALVNQRAGSDEDE